MAEEGFKRKLTAIFSADAAIYSCLMGADEAATVRILTSYRNVISTFIKQHRGSSRNKYCFGLRLYRRKSLALLIDPVYWFPGGRRRIIKSLCCIVIELVLISLVLSVNAQEVNKMMRLTSSGFENQKGMASKFTCDGADISPALEWSGVPDGTRSLALIVDDPDAPDPANPRMTWVHWVLYNIPATVNTLPEGVKDKDLPKGTLQGLNDWKKQATAAPVRLLENIDISSNFMLWILFFRTCRARPNQNWKKRWKGIFFPRQS